MDILFKQLLSKGIINEEEWYTLYKSSIKLVYNSTNDYAEIKRLNVLKRRIEALDSISEYVLTDENDAQIIFSRDYVLKNIMKFTDEEIKELDTQIKKEKSTKENINTDIEKDDVPNTDEKPTKEKVDKEDEDVEESYNDEEIDFEKIINEDVNCDINDLESYIKEKGLKDGDELIINDNLKYIYKNGELIENKA
jgi:hypothetical protein